ncbi:DUF3105 domain-containing protein [Glycomyces sp. NPDC049804]|uniref:DUF3105 domain-containing protein n=1 Tax=Glycomyces sp. NPDC049804 TaxID=3154363 RepID=UPI00341519DE
MASKKQTASKGSGKSTGKGAVVEKGPAAKKDAAKGDTKGGLSKSSAPANARRGRAVQVKQPKPWGLIWTFTGVGVVALGLIGAAVFVVWDRSQPPEGVTDFYGEYKNYSEVTAALQDGDIKEEDLENPWVVQQTHIDGEDPMAVPEYEITPPAGGNHLSQWQTCTGSVYDAPIMDGNAVHSLEHGAVWLTYDPALVDGDGIEVLAKKVEGRDFSLMSPYPEMGVAVSVQAWGVQYKTDDINDPKIDEFMDFYIQNADNAAEPGAQCANGLTTTTADQQMPTG